jgi:hypothetical protein
MIDVKTERLISLSQASHMLPPGRRGRPVSVSCIVRWILYGVQTPAGLMRLDGIRLGRRWIVSVEALARFAAAQTPRLEPKVIEDLYLQRHDVCPQWNYTLRPRR